MVQLSKVSGQRGGIVIQEDGTILSSSGDLASNEQISQQITTLLSNSIPINFAQAATRNGDGNGSNGGGNNSNGNGSNDPATGTGFGDTLNNTNKHFKWNRITVNFGDKSYMACLSNRKIHAVKREHGEQAIVITHQPQ